MKKRMTLLDKAEEAMKKAIEKVVAEHKKSGKPLSVWANGRVKKLQQDNFSKQSFSFLNSSECCK